MSSCRAIVSTDKRCPACGASFPCLGGCCWCGEVTLDDAARARLLERYADCLCPACLRACATGPAAVVPTASSS
jgi:hypothetical protein